MTVIFLFSGNVAVVKYTFLTVPLTAQSMLSKIKILLIYKNYSSHLISDNKKFENSK